jgi:uncharacterized RDD family membrane protein YckC
MHGRKTGVHTARICRMRRESGALSTPAFQPDRELDWKQEVNQRIAAHKSRKDSGAAGKATPVMAHSIGSSRAAQAAARVAERFSHAPSYNQMLAEEARAAVRAAEAASQAALKMQAAAESVLAELESVARVEPATPQTIDPQRQRAAAEPGTYFDSFLELERPAAKTSESIPASALEIRWESDLPVRPSQPERSRTSRRLDQYSFETENWRGPAAAYGEPETVEPAQTIPANLIEFPRELIAARKARPRIAEGPLAPEDGEPGQLSIFEVDPGTISTLPAPADAATEAHSSGWSKLRLDAETAPEPAHDYAAAQAHAIHMAPLNLRLMAAVVDAAMIGAAFAAVALVAAGNLGVQPSMKTMELAAFAALFVIGVLYQGFFFMLAGMTPGMRYAGIALCNFDGEKPTREQLRRRVGATLLSLLPVGLGVLWAIFDDDHLSWHDRISRTYQRWA